MNILIVADTFPTPDRNAADLVGALLPALPQSAHQLIRHVRRDLVSHTPRTVRIRIQESLDNGPWRPG